MCQLVLGAGAMATAGLRSITAKHLALSAQAAGAFIALHPLLRGALAAPVPHARRALLSPDFDRLLQVGCGVPCSRVQVCCCLTMTAAGRVEPCSTVYYCCPQHSTAC